MVRYGRRLLMLVVVVRSWSRLSADNALSPKITSAPFPRWLAHPCDRRHHIDAGHTRHKIGSNSLYGDLPDMRQGLQAVGNTIGLVIYVEYL